MDCEKFENVMIDELYGELDEVTSAAAKRHLSGCSRCAALFANLKGTRKVAKLAMVEPPSDLEQKVLAAAWEAQKVVPIRSRMSRALAWAGSFAMRPQTAMAAVFLLMIGSSVLFLQSKREASAPSAAMNRFDNGYGVPAEEAQEQDKARERVDLAAAASAHGTAERPNTIPPMAAPTTAARDLAPMQQQEQATGGAVWGAPGGGGGARSSVDDLLGEKRAEDESLAKGKLSNAAAPAGAPPAATATAGPIGQGMADTKSAQSADLDRGMASYRAGKYDDATKTLDGVAGSDPNAALWAARSVRDGSGCAAAVPRFDELSTRQWGTTVGYEATLDAGRCYRQLGRTDVARARFSSLLAVPAYMVKAQEELDQMTPKAAAKPAPRAIEIKK